MGFGRLGRGASPIFLWHVDRGTTCQICCGQGLENRAARPTKKFEDPYSFHFIDLS